MSQNFLDNLCTIFTTSCVNASSVTNNHGLLLNIGPRIHASQWSDTENSKTAEDSAVAAAQYIVQGTSNHYMNHRFVTYSVTYLTLKQ